VTAPAHWSCSGSSDDFAGALGRHRHQSAYTFTLNPKKYGKKFTVRLRAYDKAGNLKTSTKRTYRR